MSSTDPSYPFDLGTYTRPVTCTAKQAQVWFDRGLVWMYAYNHEEAILCFQRALKEDPTCAMAHWGVAYGIGPNYNKPWEAFEEDEKPAALETARTALEAAVQLLDKLTPVERALIQALQQRYPVDNDNVCDCNDNYSDAMRQVYQKFPDDLDVCVLTAEALMNRTPWELWDLKTGAPPAGAETLEALRILDLAFSDIKSGAWKHAGLLHMYIHLQEMSPHPEKALRHGDALVSLVPDAGHLIHMPTHIDVLCGDYTNVVTRNNQAIVVDRKYAKLRGTDNFYTLYRLHDYHFKIYGAMLLGQSTPALETADELMETLPPETLRPMADWFESFYAMKQHVFIRFGMWKEILSETFPEDAELYCVTTALMRYARTVALANTGEIAKAEKEAELFHTAMANVALTRTLFNNNCRDILQVARCMMLGELEYHKGNYKQAFAHLRKSIELDDNLPYDEPWGWMQPTRHALGALLLEQGRVDEAEAVYRADLGLDTSLSRAYQHPVNVWSLHGLYECLTRRGETAEVIHIKTQLDKALARAEIPIRASCYCRRREECCSSQV